MKFHFLPHIAVQVNDLPAAKQFYQSVMGMDFLPEDTNETRLLASGVTFYLEEHPANKVFFAFEVDSLEEARKMLLGHHCRITSEMQEGFMVSDPYGLSYFVSEKAKDVSQ